MTVKKTPPLVAVRNVSARGDLDVPLLGRVVEHGATVEVTAEQAGLLLEQPDNWQPAQGDNDDTQSEERA